MDKTNRNHSIKCAVDSCRYHCNNGEYCSLSQIQVGTHEKNPTQGECTDCQSFETMR